MNITAYSFLIAVFWCDIFIVLSALLQRRNGFLVRFSFFPLLFLMLASIFRLFCYFELPFVTVIRSKTILPAIQEFFATPLFIAIHGSGVIYLSTILGSVWICVGAFCFLKSIVKYVQFCRIMDGERKAQDDRIYSIMQEIVSQSRPGIKTNIIQSPMIDSPMVIGFFEPTLYLPDLQFSDVELKYILLHEWNHYIHKDSWIKLLVQITCSIFWWNPLIYLLKCDLDHTLEIKSDLRLIEHMTEDARIQYLETVLKVAKNISGKEPIQETSVFGVGFVSPDRGERIKQRFHLVLDYKPKKFLQKLGNLIFCAVMLLMLSGSFIFVVQPYTMYPTKSEDTGEYFRITPDNAYLIDNKDGTFSLFADGEYKSDFSDITYEPFSSLPIYQK